MFRRIQLIGHYTNKKQWMIDEDGGSLVHHYISGLMGLSHIDIADAWANDLRGPDRSIPDNCKFFFTEKGWDKLGRNVIAACIKTGQEYRVISIKETDANVVWRDKFTGYEVAIQPKRKRK